MPYFVTRASTEETRDEEVTGYVTDGEVRASVENPAAENGDDDNLEGGCFWLNSARIRVDPDRDEVTLTCSIGDPRGAFAFTIRRIQAGPNKGQIIIHTPYPGESFAHLPTRQEHEGTLVVLDSTGSNPLILEDPAEVRELESKHEAIDDAFDALYGAINETIEESEDDKPHPLAEILDALSTFDRIEIKGGDPSPLNPIIARIEEICENLDDVTFEGYQNDLLEAINEIEID